MLYLANHWQPILVSGYLLSIKVMAGLIDSVGGCSPGCERCSESTCLSEQRLLRRRAVHHAIRLARQRRQSRHRLGAVVLYADQHRPEPVVGGRPWSAAARH